MRPPSLLLSAGLLAWGWAADTLPYALPMAALLEGARWLDWRWELSDADFNRITDLTNLLFLGATIYLFAQAGAQGVFLIARSLPLILFPLVAAQVFSSRGDLALSSLMLSLRRLDLAGPGTPRPRVDLRIPYFAICLVATGVATAPESAWFYPLMLGAVGWALLVYRPRRYHLGAWLLALLVAGGLGYGAQSGLRAAHLGLEDLVMAWFEDRLWSRRDPYQASTAIGQIGRLKLSDRIVMRVRLAPGESPPLLRQASYQDFAYATWRAPRRPFRPLSRAAGPPAAWRLASKGRASAWLEVSIGLRRGRALLGTPGGGLALEGLEGAQVSANPYGAVRVEEGPPLATYRVRYQSASARDLAPELGDRAVPERQRELFDRVAGRLGLVGQPPEEVLRRLRGYFARDFRYSLVQRDTPWSRQPLSVFLEHSRAGHCEYFATATVLLLRTAGIPARYATGYSIQEYSELEGVYRIRRRHAHSWALAYIDGSWRDVDYTPAVWASLEDDHAPWWEPIYDLASWLTHRYQLWQLSEDGDEDSLLPYLLALVALSTLLAWRLSRKPRVSRQRKDSPRGRLPEGPGADSELYRIVSQLESRGLTRRRPGESLAAWSARLAALGAIPEPALLQRLVRLHYRYRFDPLGLSTEQRRGLREAVETWLGRAT